MTYEEIYLIPISQTRYILNIDRAHNKEKIFQHWKRDMNSILNLNTTWSTGNFINYLELSFCNIVADWCDSVDEECSMY